MERDKREQRKSMWELKIKKKKRKRELYDDKDNFCQGGRGGGGGRGRGDGSSNTAGPPHHMEQPTSLTAPQACFHCTQAGHQKRICPHLWSHMDGQRYCPTTTTTSNTPTTSLAFGFGLGFGFGAGSAFGISSINQPTFLVVGVLLVLLQNLLYRILLT